MDRFQRLWHNLTDPLASDPDSALREHMTRVVLLMQGIALIVFTIPIIVGWIAGAFPLEAVLIMLSLLVPTVAGFWLAYRGGWHFARHFPAIMFFSIGLYFSYLVPMGMTPLLMFILAVMLTSILQGLRAYWLVLGFSLLAYFAIGAGRSLEPIQMIIEAMIIVGGSFTGIALLQWFTISQFQKALQNLHTEIAEREKADEELKQYSYKLEEMVEDRIQDLHDAQKELVRREKLATMGQLGGSVAHELRNPLGVISNVVFLLKASLTDTDDDAGGYLDIISSEINGATQIIDNLLSLSRKEIPIMEEIPVAELVARGLVRQGPPEGVKVSTIITDETLVVRADPSQVVQVLENLINNAYQAMPDGGELTIKAREENNNVVISVTDTGYGIHEENLKEIFEPLFTTRRSGVGLGLAISRDLIGANKGSIEVESVIGHGTTFTLRLPGGS